MRVHAKFKKDEVEEDLYFADPTAIITEKEMSLEEAFKKAECYMQKGYFVIPAIAYEASVDNGPFIMGVFKKSVTGSYFREGKYEKGFFLSEPTLMESSQAIKNNVEYIRKYIREGHTYQVNYTTRLNGEFYGDGHALFEQLMDENNGNYAVYIEHQSELIISCSPELFFEILPDRTIRTSPMKGTAPRGKSREEDRANFRFLRNSEKDRAENVMIVDLLRNDLSRVAEENTVSTPKLFTIEQYATVYQMTSTVEAKLRKDLDLPAVFNSLFPCGSITGAPKKSTMNIINALESNVRGYYCGAIGIMYPDQSVIFNIPIRTLYVKNNRYIYGAGAGITYDSIPEEEYQEIIDKTAFLKKGLYQLIETMRLENGKVKRFDLHEARYQKSSKALGFNMLNFSGKVDDYIKDNGLYHGLYRLRATVDYKGHMNITHTSFQDTHEAHQAVLALEPIYGPLDFFEHKTSVRYHYKRYDDDFSIVLYYNDKRQLTEFNIGNLVIYENGMYYTPSEDVKLLNGVMRQSLINHQLVKERNYTVEELMDKLSLGGVQLYLINSVREWVKIELNILG